MIVRLTQLDGFSLPNIALMRLSAWHKRNGDTVVYMSTPDRMLGEIEEYDRTYGSAIFGNSRNLVERFVATWPGAIVGGTGSRSYSDVETYVGRNFHEFDYSLYPKFTPSIGFSSRGCRGCCPFCVVPMKEGAIRSVAAIEELRRKDSDCMDIVLLDNDFFGQPEWFDRCKELDGRYRVNLNQGINVRRISDEQAKWAVRLNVMDVTFSKRRLYIAWDNLKEETAFFNGVVRLLEAGFKPGELMVYMLIGYEQQETIEQIMYRYDKINGAGMLPYPMIFGDNPIPVLRKFQRWVVRHYDDFVPWETFVNGVSIASQDDRQGAFDLEVDSGS
jgi:hypothetical protein